MAPWPNKKRAVGESRSPECHSNNPNFKQGRVILTFSIYFTGLEMAAITVTALHLNSLLLLTEAEPSVT